MRGALQIGSFRGIPLRVHWTLLLVLPLLAALFAADWREAAALAGVSPSAVTLAPWIWGLLVAVGLFASVLVHELAHSLYARRVGLRVRGIVLLLIGGISEIVDPPERPGQEALMAFVGPLTSLVLGVLFGVAGLLLRPTAPGDLVFALLLLGQLNLVLGIFNLLPAFPMDGGRILRAGLTAWLGQSRATRAAVAVGRVFAVLFVLLGLYSGSFLLLFVAFFVWMGAGAEGAQVSLREALTGQRVGDLLGERVEGVDPLDTVEVAAMRMRRARALVLPVVEEDTVRGLLSLEAVRAVPATRRPFTAVRAVARAVEPVPVDSDAWTALQRMSTEGLGELPVVEDARYVGLLTQADLLRGVRLRALDEELRARGGVGRPVRR